MQTGVKLRLDLSVFRDAALAEWWSPALRSSVDLRLELVLGDTLSRDFQGPFPGVSHLTIRIRGNAEVSSSVLVQ